ncbi:MAG: hypothetical protein PVH41_09540 [Anaerolineae bacterium]|jgi:N-acetylglutamate synthase-like GNAT family acetyltransferase
MIDTDGIVARRARASDGEKLFAFVTRALRGRLELDAEAVLARLGEVGFFLAERDGRLLGLLGWHVEDLVACVTDLLIWSAADRLEVAEVLLEEMESEAAGLSAEAALLLLPKSSSPELLAFCGALGYSQRVVADLPGSWRQTALEAGRSDAETIPVKQLRAEYVVRPL